MARRIAAIIGAATLGMAGLTAAAPAEARTIVRVGIGVPVYPRPYRWGYYPPRPYYAGPSVVIGGVYGRPYGYRPYGYRPFGYRPYGYRPYRYGRPRWHRW